MRLKKSLGQNFLTSTKIVEEIARAGNIKSGDTVLEIGPGMGILTKEILKSGARVIAIEKDDRLIVPLSEMFKKEIKKGLFILIHADVLDLVHLTGMSPAFAKVLGNKYKIIANIPYYITGEIIKRFTTVPNAPTSMVLLVQKEVANRIAAKDNKESILSVAVKMYGSPSIIRNIPRGAFAPSPNVDSAVILIDKIRHFGTPKEEKEFFEIIHAAFHHKRKILSSNIKDLPKNLKERSKKILEKYDLLTARAEDVPISIWRKMIQ